ncbi:MAG: aminoglycoside phosphotransferase family protein [Chloroflexi bacterium]|nr:aminoglycoside phosphotransferase family protein [Chloroflexota bacterium]OJV88993.1 MAG: hypothetical protein BGO39_32850 [Chloroflexi bacterium 54-19]
MLERASIDDSAIITVLEKEYGLKIDNFEFLPVGAAGWSYRAETAPQGRWFVKLRQGKVYPPAVEIPVVLRQSLKTELLLPALPTRQGDLWAETANFYLAVYPYLTGHNAMDLPLNDTNWQKIGRFFAGLHSAGKIPILSDFLKVEKFNSDCQQIAPEVLNEALHKNHEGVALILEKFIREKAAEITRIIARTRQLGQILREKQPEMVLCHGDPNTSNIFVTETGELYVLDWDEVMLAPPERDLMFFANEKNFWQGYDRAEWFVPDRTTLAYYRYEWVVQEIADFGEQVFWGDLTLPTKEDALQKFRQLFNPGDVVEEAYQAEKFLI